MTGGIKMNDLSKAVFLDLQGTLGGDGLADIMDFRFFPCSIEAIRLLNKHNILAIVVTNQSHISRGYLTISDFNDRVEDLKRELSKEEAHLDAIYCCPHGGEDICACKKPLSGMLVQAKKELNISLEDSYVIGDMGMSDIVMAKAVGAKGILVLTGVGEGSLTTFKHTWADIDADFVAENVLEAVKWIIQKENLYGN